jgi:hypothetical protein
MEVLQVFLRLMYSPAGSGASLDMLSKDSRKIVKTLISKAKKLLLRQHLSMSLNNLEEKGEE